MSDRQFASRYGPWALVTGATSGIGKEMAHQLAELGCNIVLVARHRDRLQSAAADLQNRFDVETRIVCADLGQSRGYQDVIDGTSGLEIGLLVPCAGTVTHGRTSEIAIERELALVQLNVSSVMALAHHFTSLMADRGKGGVLFVASVSGHIPGPYLANYSGSKAYILNYAKSLYWELKGKGVDVTILSPGHTDTPMLVFEDIDIRRSPLFVRPPAATARAGIKALGKKLLVIPGIENKVAVFAGTASPAWLASTVMGKIIERMFTRQV